MPSQSASRASAAIGSMIFSVFGGGWLFAWYIKAYGLKPGFLVLITFAALAIILLAYRQFRNNQSAHSAESDSPESKRSSRIFSIVNVAQGIAIFLAANITANLGHKEWFIPAFIFIVGAHFLPLAASFKTRRHYVTGVSMILLAVVYPLVAKGGPSNPIGCLGTGFILWASAISGLLPVA